MKIRVKSIPGKWIANPSEVKVAAALRDRGWWRNRPKKVFISL